jgi:hypothetical protein
MTYLDIDKITNLIVKLNKNTSQGKILWRVSSPPGSLTKGTQAVFPLFFRTEYKGQNFALYQCRSLEPEPLTLEEFTRPTFLSSFIRPAPKKNWEERIILAMLDNEGRVLWEGDAQQSALSDLFDTVRRKVSNIDAILDAILSDDDEIPAPLPQ